MRATAPLTLAACVGENVTLPTPILFENADDSAVVRIQREEMETAAAIELGASPEVTIGLTDPPLSRVVSALFLAGGGVVIADGGSHRILFYSGEGEFIRAVGGEGDGPTEYREIASMYRMGTDSVVVYDERRKRLDVYDRQGDLVRAAPVASEDFPSRADFLGLFREGALVSKVRVTARRPGVYRDTVVLVSGAPSETATGDTVAVVPEREWYGYAESGPWAQLPFGGTLTVSVTDDHLAMALTDRFRIVVLDPRGSVLRIIEADEVGRRVRSSDVDRWMDEQVASVSPALRPEIRRMVKEVPAAEFLPVIERIVFDDEGRLWVEAFAAEDDAGHDWWVLSLEGALVATVGMPASHRLLAVADGSVLVLATSALGIETVEVWRLGDG